MQIQAPVLPVLDGTEAHRTKHVAPVNGEAKRSMPIASLRCRENCFHQIRRKMATPEATFFVFLLRPFPISSFHHECNPSPLLENYKRGGKGHI
jgi:hypothetical protein